MISNQGMAILEFARCRAAAYLASFRICAFSSIRSASNR
jgi:hypothetical protein